MFKHGANVKNLKTCPKCNKQLENGVCPNCGTKYTEEIDEKKGGERTDQKTDLNK